MDRERRIGQRCAGWLLATSLALALPGQSAIDRDAPTVEGRQAAVRLSGFYDPARGFLEATARLRFTGQAAERPLWLANELQLKSVSGGSMTLPPFSSDSGEFVVQCPAGGELVLDYGGRLSPGLQPLPAEPAGKKGADDCRILSHVMDYYPHPQGDFMAMDVTIRVPGGWSCLGSGVQRSVANGPGYDEYSFSHPLCKGMTLVFGRFRPLGVLAGEIPLRLYGWKGIDFRRYYVESDMAGIAGFYRGRFGPLPVPELAILFRRGEGFRGVSYSGLLVLNVDRRCKGVDPFDRETALETSLLAMADPATDLLAHEMAHQWWGGVVSWKQGNDNWIAEGLATYSSLLYLRQRFGEKRYRAACQRLRAGLERYAGAAVPADGAKLKVQFRDPAVYQALAYVKPALMLVELAGARGEDEVCRRLRGVLEARRGRSLDGREFLDLLADGDPGMRTWMNEWIFSKTMPQYPDKKN
ncbi:MAG TPA: M1 family aminopeptidase [Candidatus Aminicenantes bacterium]|nr:M1 family aminopeptidase [Candidatus Aminicenantes bacterium]